jgi:hypothetical protein
MKIRKMPFEHNSFILSEDGGRGLNTVQWNDVAEWLRSNDIKYNMQAGVLTLYEEVQCSLFILRWMGS